MGWSATRCGWALPVLLALGGCVVSRPLYTDNDVESDGAGVAPDEHAGGAAWSVAGMSTQGRPVKWRILGSGPRRILWIGGIHGNEREGSVATAELPDECLADPGWSERVTLAIVEDLNPDGSFADRRSNANGIDLNRNFPASNFRASRSTGATPLDQNESKILHDLIRSFAPELVVVCHSARNGPFINYDGPALDLARQFSRLSGYRLVTSDTLHSTPGSLGSWVGRDLGMPILTLEFRNGQDAETGWRDTRAAILALLEAG